jgi:pantoate ligase / CMP/dCMP kinase
VSESGLLAVAVKLGTTRLIDNITLQEHKPIIAIDGPAGAGKSTVTREVAQKLGLLYLDTGAMYRAVTWLVLNQGIDIEDHQAIAQLVQNSEIKLETTNDIKNFTRVWINDQEITQEIRSLEITSKVSAIAALPVVRTELVKQQQKYGKKGGIVAEGRDICTHVFPQAEVKIYLTASARARAIRRQKDLQEQGQPLVNLEYLEQTIQERDHQDSNRAIAPLQKAPDAIEIITDKLSINDVVNQIISLYHQALEQSETQTHV